MTTRDIKPYFGATFPISAAVGCTGKLRAMDYIDDPLVIECSESVCSFYASDWKGDLDLELLTEAQALHDEIALGKA